MGVIGRLNILSVSTRSLAVACALTAADPLRAQQVGSLAAERARLAEITGVQPDTATLRPVSWIRGPNHLVRPEVRLTWNSATPHSFNDGAMWAGRGLSGSVMGGLAFEVPTRPVPLRVTVAPRVTWAQNTPFQIFAGTSFDRSQYANPFYNADASADYPMRFGDRPIVAIDPGASRAEFAGRGLRFGVTSAEEWWGPAIRNTLVLSNNAQGVPRLYVRNAAPFSTRAGKLDVHLIAGTLTESRFFDFDDDNDYRSLSGVRLELQPAFDSTLSLGFSRVVYAKIDGFAGTLIHAADVVWRWQWIHGVGSAQSVDQIMSVFGRWTFPRSGFEVYGEFARMDNPHNLTDLLTAVHYTGGYTLGLQWARPRGQDVLRVQSEITYLEQTSVYPDRPPPDFYSGRATLHGYTQRGQVLGAAIGPGGSSQFVGADYVSREWQGGWFGGRIRWNNDALYRKSGANFFQHDVTLFTGLRGARRTPWTDISAELTYGYRFNYLFQWGEHDPGGFRTVDVRNVTLAITATPR